MNWKFEKGYKDERIVDPNSIDLDELKTDKDFIVAYAELSKASHWRKDPIKGNLASEKSKQIVDEVRTRLERVEWHAHIFKTGSCECNCDRDDYLHATCGMPEIHQVEFSSQWNIELTEYELFNKDGSLRQKHEALELLRKRIGDKPLNPDELMKEGLMTKETYETIRAIMDEEGFLEVHEIDEEERTFRSGAKSYTWRDSEDEAEEEAREYLEDGEMWKMAVEAERTTLGFDDWVEFVLNMDGWEHELCTYDGCSHELENGKVYWRTN